MESRTLVIGSAGKKTPGAITLDIDPNHNPDVVYDITKPPLPFKDNQFTKIIAHHVLEHLSDISNTMYKLHRICSSDGEIYIEVPHHTSWCANITCHKLRFNYFAFDIYTNDDSWNTGKKFTVLKKEICFHKAFRRYFLHKLFNKFPMSYEKFWAYIFPAEFFKIWLRPGKD